MFDVFLSYRHLDTAALEPFVDALHKMGLRVWRDTQRTDELDRIQRSIEAGLQCSKLLVAWYSRSYPDSRACQWELTHGYLAAQREGDPLNRVLVVNPELGEEHILPETLRDQLLLQVPDRAEPAAYFPAAAAVARRAAEIKEPFSAIRTPPAAPWHGEARIAARSFYGRRQEMWKIHSVLTSEERPMLGGRPGALALLTGFGGIGKSLLAREYALLYEAFYPGGIFWLRAHGVQDNGSARGGRSESLMAQLHDVAQVLGVSREVGSDSLPALTAAFQARGEPFLWIVDDLGSGLSEVELRGWLAPHGRLGKTLITTRTREYNAIGQAVELDGLSSEEGYDLLTSRRTPTSASEKEAARGIVDDLGFHPLAIELAAAALKAYGADSSFSNYRLLLSNPQTDELELAKELTGLLPNGHEKSISVTLRRSFRELGRGAHDVVCLAAILADAPIPHDMISGILAVAEGLDPGQGVRHAALGRAEAHRLSLIEELPEERGIRVHVLISRVVRRLASARCQELFGAAIESVTGALGRDAASVYQQKGIELSTPVPPGTWLVMDPLLHQMVEQMIPHALHLVRDVSSKQSFQLLVYATEYERERGSLDAAAALYRRQIELASALFPKSRVILLSAQYNLGVMLSAMGLVEEAEAVLLKITSATRRTFGRQPQEFVMALHALGKVAGRAGDYALAVKRLRKAALSTSDPHISAGIQRDLAANLGSTGALQESRDILRSLVQNFYSLHAPGNPERILALLELARTELRLGSPQEGLRFSGPAVEEAKGVGWTIGHPTRLAAIEAHVEALIKSGNLVEAHEVLGRSLKEVDQAGLRSDPRIATLEQLLLLAEAQK